MGKVDNSAKIAELNAAIAKMAKAEISLSNVGKDLSSLKDSINSQDWSGQNKDKFDNLIDNAISDNAKDSSRNSKNKAAAEKKRAELSAAQNV